jgi:hypothetical protein
MYINVLVVHFQLEKQNVSSCIPDPVASFGLLCLLCDAQNFKILGDYKIFYQNNFFKHPRPVCLSKLGIYHLAL